MSQIEPHRARVRPRVRAPGGETLLLEDVLAEDLERAETGAICICGPRGWGKSTALAHLAVVLPRGSMATFLDEPPEAMVRDLSHDTLVVYASSEPHGMRHLATHRMEAWGVDECLEYLMARDRNMCGSVLERLRNRRESPMPSGAAGLWVVVMDEMIQDAGIRRWQEAVRHRLDRELTPLARSWAAHACLYALTVDGARVLPGSGPLEPPSAWFRFLMRGEDPPVKGAGLVIHPPVQQVLAAERIVKDLKEHGRVPGLEVHLSEGLLGETGRLLKGEPEALRSLEGHLSKWTATAATLLHASDTGWKPTSQRCWDLRYARLPRAYWPGIRLKGSSFERANLSGAFLRDALVSKANFQEAKLSGADLGGARLDGTRFMFADLSGVDLGMARGKGTVFSGADLRGAVLEGAKLTRADFRMADLGRSNLKRVELSESSLIGARLGGADLSMADLTGVHLLGADLRGASLSGAAFVKADLRRIKLEGVEVRGGNFEEGDLRNALLTGSTMPGAVFRKALLRGAKLADIDWPGVDLRGADLSGASFHMGSSRSGLLFGAPPGEGSRTGYYIDEYHNLDFKDPAEIRVANLFGADLRGAQIVHTDFYLVDLRGAKYDPDQEAHFRRCGAILEIRA